MVIRADTDQYQTIHCNIAAHIGRPYSVICLMGYTGGSDQRRCSIAAQAHNSPLVRMIKSDVKCSLYCCLLPSCSSIHLWLWVNCDWMFPWFASCCLLYIQRRQISVDSFVSNPTWSPDNVTQSVKSSFIIYHIMKPDCRVTAGFWKVLKCLNSRNLNLRPKHVQLS